MSALSFINIHGERVFVDASKPPKRPRAPAGQKEFHKGWKVVGIPPGQYEKECAENAKAQAVDRKIGGDVRPDLPPYNEWANAFRLKPVRAKPYEIPDAAQVCADLAKKCGWDRVFVVEIKREKQAA